MFVVRTLPTVVQPRTRKVSWQRKNKKKTENKNSRKQNTKYKKGNYRLGNTKSANIFKTVTECLTIMTRQSRVAFRNNYFK